MARRKPFLLNTNSIKLNTCKSEGNLQNQGNDTFICKRYFDDEMK